MMAVVLLVFAVVFASVAAMAWHHLLAQLKFSEIPAALLILVCGRAYRRQLHGILTRRETAARVAAKTRPPLPAVKPAKLGAKRPMPPSAPARLPSAGLPQPFGYPVASTEHTDRAVRAAREASVD